MDDRREPSLSKWISIAVDKMRSQEGNVSGSPADMAVVRQLHLSLKPFLFGDSDEKTRFLAFFLTSYIDSVFMDLLGDVPDDDEGLLRTIRSQFFKNLVSGFEDLLKVLRDRGDILPPLQALIGYYVDTVNRLNYEDLRLGGVN